MRQEARLLQETLAELKQEGWTVDYRRLTGVASVGPVPRHTTMISRLTFLPEQKLVSIYFRAQMPFQFNAYAKNFFGHLYLRLKQREVALELTGPGSFEVMWFIKNPESFQQGGKDALRGELVSNLQSGQHLVLSCLHVVKSCFRIASDKKMREERRRAILHPSILAAFVEHHNRNDDQQYH